MRVTFQIPKSRKGRDRVAQYLESLGQDAFSHLMQLLPPGSSAVAMGEDWVTVDIPSARWRPGKKFPFDIRPRNNQYRRKRG